MNILRAREIAERSVTSRVPMMPACIVGVMNLRGRVVPVIDLAVKLGLPPTRVSRWTCVLIVETELDGENTRLGLLIDGVGDVLTLSEDETEILVDALEADLEGYLEAVKEARGNGNRGDVQTFTEAAERIQSLITKLRDLLD